MIAILSTKKLTRSIKDSFFEAGIHCRDLAFIKTKSISFELKTTHEIIVFTSKKAVKSVAKSKYYASLKGEKCLCVGTKTAKKAQKLGFNVLEITDYAEDLTTILAKKYEQESFTFFCGSIRKDTIPNYFKKNNVVYNEVIVYETFLNPIKIEHSVKGLLFFSPSAVESYAMENQITTETCFCIGKTTAKALTNKTTNIIIAKKPLLELVIDEAIKYFNK